MSILDVALNLAETQTDKIAKVIGKSPQQVRSAIQQGKKILPEVMTSSDGGIGVLNRMGVDRKFMDDMYKRYGSYASKIPGLNKNVVDNTLNAIENAMDKPAQTQKKSSGFDSKKYPKL